MDTNSYINADLDKDLLLIESLQGSEDLDLEVDKVGGAFLGALFNINAFSASLHLESYFCAYTASGITALGTRFMGSYVNTLIEKNISKDVADHTALATKAVAIASLLYSASYDKDSLKGISLNLLNLIGSGLICETVIKGVSERYSQISEALEATEELWDIHRLKEE